MICLLPYSAEMSPLEPRETRLLRDYFAETAVAFLDGITGLEMQPQKYNRAPKVSCYLDEAPDPDSAMVQTKRSIE